MGGTPTQPLVAIACGGTGGHLFPGLAVAHELIRANCDVLLLISPREVDQSAVKSAVGMKVAVLPAVGLIRGHWLAFAVGAWKSYRHAARLFAKRPPRAVLAMGGFTSAPPVLAGRRCGARTFLHESNTVPGRANRWIARRVDQAFVGFPQAAERLRLPRTLVTGTPVRWQFQMGDPAAARVALGLDPERPTLLITGGSQGAVALNDLLLAALPKLIASAPDLQYLHLTGPVDVAKVRAAYQQSNARAIVRPFLSEMEWALGAATVAVSRAGGSSLAELAAMRLPAVLIPYPTAADHHQLVNAQVYAGSGAALLLEQGGASGERLADLLVPLVLDPARRAAMARALERWHSPECAGKIARRMVEWMNANSASGVG